MVLEEPLKYFSKNTPFEKNNIKRFAIGEKYTGVLLHNGNIGVCSNLHNDVKKDLFANAQLKLDNTSHRIIYNAYLNATFNYANEFNTSQDIFDHIDFVKKERIAMVGYFKPLVKKFTAANINLHIFDKVEKDDILSPIREMNTFLEEASTLILTSTSVFNGTFLDIIIRTNPNCDIYLLGPSSILHPDLKKYKNIKQIYGAVFEPYDERILDLIGEGHGTQTFLPLGKKVHI